MVVVALTYRKDDLNTMQQSIETDMCSIWYANNPNKLVDLRDFGLTFKPNELSELICAFFIIGVVGSAVLGGFYVITRGFHNMLHEQIHRLNMVVEISELMQLLIRDSFNSSKPPVSILSTSNVDLIYPENSTNNYNFSQLKSSIAPYLCYMTHKDKLRSLFGLP